jgi:hypothetical protein
MVDSVAVFPPGFRVLDSTGAPVNNAKIKFREIGGGDAKEVFSAATLAAPSSLGTIVRTRSDGYPVVSFGSNTTTLIYTGSDPYHIEITDENDVAIFPAQDNVVGAVDTDQFLTASELSTLSIPVLTKTGNYNLVLADKGKLIAGNATGGFFSVRLPDAVEVGDAWTIGIRNDGTANPVGIISGENIQTAFGTALHLALAPGETMWFLSNGATWKVWAYTPPLWNTTGVILIADRLSAPPVSPTGGARYILLAAPSGLWSSFAQHDIAEANGQGDYFKFTPPTNCGWLAYVQSENQFYQFRNSAWTPIGATDTALGFVELAVQAEMEAHSETSAFAVVPGRMKYSPACLSAWVFFQGTGTVTINSDFGVSSVADGGAGAYTANFDTNFANGNFSAVLGEGTTSDAQLILSTRAVGSLVLSGRDSNDGSLQDIADCNVHIVGDFP